MPKLPPPASEVDQLALYQRAVRALGGINAHASLIGISPRHAGRLFSGAYPLSTGIVADTAAALIQHADLCRQLERALSPAFAANLTPHQRNPPRRGRPSKDAD